MNISEELYREVILDHFKSPRHYGRIDWPDVLEIGMNPLCGDELELFLTLKDGHIKDIRFQGKGCSISQASASMMTEAVLDRKIPEAQKMIFDFKAMMLEGKPAESLPEALEDSKSLEGIKNYPVRIKCALLSWNTLLEGLKRYAQKQNPL